MRWARSAIADSARLGVLLIAGLAVQQEDAERPGPYRIGVLFWHDSPNDKLAFDGFRAGLELSGCAIEFDVHNVHSDEGEARRRLRDFEERAYDLVLSLGTRATQLAREELERTPVVYTAVTNPVLSGIAESWDRSGQGIAGNSNWVPADTLVRAFLRAVPGMRRLGVLATGDNPVPAAEIRGVETAIEQSPELGVTLDVRRISRLEEITRAAAELATTADAIWIPIDILVYENLHLVRKVTDPARIPLLSSSHRGAQAGAILSIVVDYENLGKKAAAIAVRILEDGVDPRDIAVGRLAGYRTIVNLARSREIGYRLPLDVVITADRILR